MTAARRPLGYIVTGPHGFPWVNGNGQALVFGTEAEAQTFANGVYPLTGGRVWPLARWKPTPKRRHEYETT